MSDLAVFFHNSTQIKNLFTPDQDCIADPIEKLITKFVLFFQTGVWINKQTVYNWAAQYYNSDAPHNLPSSFLEGTSICARVKRIEQGLFVKKKTFLETAKAAALFFMRFIKTPTIVGSLAPSSRALSKEMVRAIPQASSSQAPRHILEVGPGTGSFTDKIIKKMNPNDVLHLVEFDPDFVETLREKYQHIPNVHIIHASILDYTPPDNIQYDFVVSGLPFAIFTSEQVSAIFTKYTNITKQGGTLSYFEYMLLPSIRMLFMGKSNRENMQQIIDAKNHFYTRNDSRTESVFFNITPALVKHHVMR